METVDRADSLLKKAQKYLQSAAVLLELEGAGALIEVEVRDRLGLGRVVRWRLVEVEAGLGVEAEVALGRSAGEREWRPESWTGRGG